MKISRGFKSILNSLQKIQAYIETLTRTSMDGQEANLQSDKHWGQTVSKTIFILSYTIQKALSSLSRTLSNPGLNNF